MKKIDTIYNHPPVLVTRGEHGQDTTYNIDFQSQTYFKRDFWGNYNNNVVLTALDTNTTINGLKSYTIEQKAAPEHVSYAFGAVPFLIIVIAVVYALLLWLQRDLRNAQAGIKVIRDQVDKMTNPHGDIKARTFPLPPIDKFKEFGKKPQSGALSVTYEGTPNPELYNHIDTLMDGHQVYMNKYGTICQIIINQDAPRVNLTLNPVNLRAMYYQSRRPHKIRIPFLHKIANLIYKYC